MTPLELAAMLITAANTLKAAGMELDKDPSKNFSDLATLVAIAYAESEKGEGIGTGQSTIVDEETGKREVSFGPFQVNEFWYKDHTGEGDVTLVNNEYTDIFDNVKPSEMPNLLKDPMNSAIAAIIIANSNEGYDNWSVYKDETKGIKEQSFDSKYWRAGFSSAAEELYELEIPQITGGVVTPTEPIETEMEEGALGMERREVGYSEREVSRFNKAVDKIAMMVNPKEGSANPETKRQIQIILGQELGYDIEELPQPRRSDYDDVDRTIIDFVAELGRQKARLGG